MQYTAGSCSFLLAVLSAPIFLSSGHAPAQEPPSTLLFDSGKEGYKRYRIPALLTTPKGTVLAFCEGRKGGKGLTGDIDIILKRSTDSGKTWQALEVVADGGGHTLGTRVRSSIRRTARSGWR